MSLECPVILSCCEGRSVALLGRRAWNLVCIRALKGETFKVQSGLKYCESLCAVAALCLAQKHESSCTFPKTFFVIWCDCKQRWRARVAFYLDGFELTLLQQERSGALLGMKLWEAQCWQNDLSNAIWRFLQTSSRYIYRENFLASSGRTPGIR